MIARETFALLLAMQALLDGDKVEDNISFPLIDEPTDKAFAMAANFSH
jgi:hypothetical protein